MPVKSELMQTRITQCRSTCDAEVVEAELARLTHFENGKQAVRPHPTEVTCYYQTLQGTDGETLLHLSTFGSELRKSNPKSSQSQQLNEAVARELVDLLRSVYPQIK